MAYAKTIEPELFNRRITVKRAAVVADDAGGTANDGFTDRFTTWAAVEEMTASRKAYYGLDLVNTYWEITLRYSPTRNFDTSDLVDYENQTLSVMTWDVVKQSYKEFSVLICTVSATY